MEVIDPGHKYKLGTLDGDVGVYLTFVKRNNPPEKFPGNEDAYPGTTTQEVIRALLNRARYVNNQFPAPENDVVVAHLCGALVALEERAARLHGGAVAVSEHLAEFGPFCLACGHVGHNCSTEKENKY